MGLSVIIVSYNTKDLTLQAVESVFSTYPDAEVIVVDNASKDDSVASLRFHYRGRITIVEHKTNVGFARANNEGMKLSHGSYVLLLNSDTIVKEHALQRMTEALQRNPEFGIVSCQLQNTDYSYQPQGGALPTLTNIAAWWLWPFPGVMPGAETYHDMQTDVPSGNGIREVGWVAGTAMMMRREVVEQVGGLDDQIFMYAEDVEYCIRARQKNWKIGIVQDAFIVHIGSASGSSAKAMTGEVKGLLYVFGKHFSVWETAIIRLIFMVGAILRYVLFGILKGSSKARELYGSILSVVLRPL